MGRAGFHDGSVLAVEHRGGTVRLSVRGASGKGCVVDFADSGRCRQIKPRAWCSTPCDPDGGPPVCHFLLVAAVTSFILIRFRFPFCPSCHGAASAAAGAASQSLRVRS